MEVDKAKEESNGSAHAETSKSTNAAPAPDAESEEVKAEKKAKKVCGVMGGSAPQKQSAALCSELA